MKKEENKNQPHSDLAKKNELNNLQKAAIAGVAGVTIGTGSAVAASLSSATVSDSPLATETMHKSNVEIEDINNNEVSAPNPQEQEVVEAIAQTPVSTIRSAPTDVEAEADIIIPDNEEGLSFIGTPSVDGLFANAEEDVFIVDVSEVTTDMIDTDAESGIIVEDNADTTIDELSAELETDDEALSIEDNDNFDDDDFDADLIVDDLM